MLYCVCLSLLLISFDWYGNDTLWCISLRVLLVCNQLSSSAIDSWIRRKMQNWNADVNIYREMVVLRETTDFVVFHTRLSYQVVIGWLLYECLVSASMRKYCHVNDDNGDCYRKTHQVWFVFLQMNWIACSTWVNVQNNRFCLPLKWEKDAEIIIFLTEMKHVDTCWSFWCELVIA